MITIKTTVTYDLVGLEGEKLKAIIADADDYEKGLKESGHFWGREDSTTAISITAQQYLDVVFGEENES